MPFKKKWKKKVNIQEVIKNENKHVIAAPTMNYISDTLKSTYKKVVDTPIRLCIDRSYPFVFPTTYQPSVMINSVSVGGIKKLLYTHQNILFHNSVYSGEPTTLIDFLKEEYDDATELNSSLKINKLLGVSDNIKDGDIIHLHNNLIDSFDNRVVQSQYSLGIIANELVDRRITEGILKTGNYYSCLRKQSLSGVESVCHDISFTMDYADLSLGKTLRSCANQGPEEITECILIQALHAMACCHHYLHIAVNPTQHQMNGDTELTNICIAVISDKTKFRGETLSDAQYFHYSVFDVDLYIPYTPILVKLFCWENSQFTTLAIREDGKQFVDTSIFNIGDEDTLTNDIIQLCNFVHTLSKYKSTPEKILSRCSQNAKLLAVNILQDRSIFGKYMTKPETGKIVTLGTIS